MTLRTDALAGAALVGLPALELAGHIVPPIWTSAALTALVLLLIAGATRTASRKSRTT